MNIGLIGSGGRNMLCAKIVSQNQLIKYFVSGNAGTSQIATNLDVDILNFQKYFKLIKFQN